MHILFVDTTLTTRPTGGPHTFLVTLCEQLRLRNWRVTVITKPGEETTIARTLEQLGVEVISNMWKSYYLPEEQASQLADWVNHRQPDIYMVYNSTDAGWLALPKIPSTLPTMAMAHNDVSAYYAPLRHYGSFIDCALGVSSEISRKLINEAAIPSQRIKKLPYGVIGLPRQLAEQRWNSNSDPNDLQIGYVGRLEQQQKRVLDLIPLAKLLIDRGVPFQLHVIGDGRDRDTLLDQIHQHGLENVVKMWGWLDSSEVKGKWSELDVFLLLSDHEGLPVALLEAMAHAVVPVVSHTVSGCPEVIVDGKNGFLVPVGDIQSFADRITTLATNRQWLNQIRQAAWETGQRYTVDRTVSEFVVSCNWIRSKDFLREHRPPCGPYPVMASCRSRYPNWIRQIHQRVLAWTGMRA